MDVGGKKRAPADQSLPTTNRDFKDHCGAEESTSVRNPRRGSVLGWKERASGARRVPARR